MYWIVANSTGDVLLDFDDHGGLAPIKFFNEGTAWDYLEERYTKSGLSLWTVEEV